MADRKPTESLRVEGACLSDRGKVRPLNEDSVSVVIPENPDLLRRMGVLGVVADGMGGHEGGELASRMTVDRVSQSYYDAAAPPNESLTGALRAANFEVLAHAREHPQLTGMGTTCTAVAVVDGAACLAHVGDSRLYLARSGDIWRMTQDHSAAMQLVAQGLLTLAEADHHEQRNVIVRAIGTRERVEIDGWKQPFPLIANDVLVLCTDGMYETVGDAEIAAACASSPDPQAVCRMLLTLALDRDGRDNISVAVLRVVSGSAPSLAKEALR